MNVRFKRRFVAAVLAACSVGVALATTVAFGGSEEDNHAASAEPAKLNPMSEELSAGEVARLRNLVSNPRTRPAPGTTAVARGRTLWRGAIWSLTTYYNSVGDFCWGLALPREGQAVTCERQRPNPQGVWATWGARQVAGGNPTSWDVVWIEGFVGERVKSVELVLTDCSREVLRADAEGVFLSLVPGETLDTRGWPHKVVAYDVAGRTIDALTLSVERPHAARAVAPGLTAPERSASCE